MNKLVRIKKRYNGLAEVRSYLFDEVKAQGKGLRFEYYDGNANTPAEVMTIPFSELSRGFVTARGIKSKINPNQVFDLVSFKWESDQKRQEREWFEKLDEVKEEVVEKNKQLSLFGEDDGGRA